MKKETILIAINEYLKEQDLVKFLQFKEKLEEDIRKESCYKTTPKARVNAIAKIFKENEKNGYASRFNGYSTNDNTDLNYFTNSYLMVAIKDTLGYEKLSQDYTNMLKDSNINEENLIELDLDLISYNHKIKEKFTNINGTNFDTEYVKIVVDTLGADTKVYQQDNSTLKGGMLYFRNKENELGLVLGVKTF